MIWMKGHLSKSPGDTKIGGVANTPEGCVALQRELERLRRWAEKKHLKVNKDKCRVLHLENINPRHQDRLGPCVQQENEAIQGVEAVTAVQVLHWLFSYTAPFCDTQMHLNPSVSHCDLIVKDNLFNKYLRSSSPFRRGNQENKLRESWGLWKQEGC